MKYSLLLFFFFILCSSTFAQLSAQKKDSILHVLSVEKEPDKMMKFNFWLAKYYFQENKLDTSLKYYNQVIAIAEKKQNFIYLGDSYSGRAKVYAGFSNYQKMLEDLLESAQWYRKANHKARLGGTLSDIAGVYYETHEFEKALESLKKAEEIAYELKDTLQIANCLLNRGLCYGVLERKEEALKVLEESERIFKSANYIKLLPNVYLGISKVYQKSNDVKKAEHYGLLAMDLCEKDGNKIMIIASRASLLDTYTLSKEFDKGDTIMKKLVPELEQIDALGFKRGVYETLIGYAEASNNYQAAYKYLKISQKLMDSLYAQERNKEQKRLETVLELKQKEVETQQKDIVIAKQRTGIIVAFLFSLFIGILLYLQYRNNKNLQKAKSLLEQQQTELSEQKKELEHLNKTKDHLFSIISHDLMAPIATLSSLLELLKQNVISAEAMPMFLDDALTEVGNTSVFLRNLLLWTKNQMDGFVVKKEVFETNKLIKNSIVLLQPQIRKKKLEVVCDFRSDVKAFADEDLIQAVFRNLLANAIKFSLEQGIIQIVVEDTSNGMLQVTIKDNGVGIPEEAKSKILGDEIYSTYGTQNEKGTGIGLALCKEFVNKCGGKIWFESEAGKGTSFYFTLPTA